MSPAERAYRLALRAYPAAYRRERGLEILTTILDGDDGRWPRVREVAAVVLDGVARRGAIAGGGSRAGSARAGVRLAAFAWLWIVAIQVAASDFRPYVGPPTGGFGPPARETLFQIVIVVVPLLALARSWWYVPLVAYLVAFACEALGFPAAGGMPWDAPDPWLGWASWGMAFAPALACALARPRSGEPRDARSFLWTPAAALLGALTAWQALFLSSWLGRPLVVILLAAVILARRDPRLAVGAACFAGLAALERQLLGRESVIWLGTSSLAAPLLLAFVLACAWRLRGMVASTS